MSELPAEVLIDGRRHSYPVEGEFFQGEDELLYDDASSSIQLAAWKQAGYCVVDLFTPDELAELISSIENRVRDTFEELGYESVTELELIDYHKQVTDLKRHVAFSMKSRNFSNEDFGFDLELVTSRLSKVVGKRLSSFNPELKRKHVQLRISRPGSLDINPPHRDAYLEYYRKVLNVWIPVAGSDENSSLPVVPGSHLIREDALTRTEARSAKISGNTYMVPCISKINDRIPEMTRPNPQPGQALIFTPFLIHGAAFNTNADTTRMALELRLYLS